jgi:hypothetical protein
MPAQAGIQIQLVGGTFRFWIPAFAGMMAWLSGKFA